MKQLTRDLFLQYVDEHCIKIGIYPMTMKGSVILSFGGSDGPKISESGLKPGPKWKTPEEVDKYIHDCCEEYCENHFPSKTLVDFLKELDG